MNAPTPGTPAPNASARQATMREFFAVVFRRRWLIVGLFAAVTVTVLAIALSTPVRFASSGRVLVTRGERESALSGRVQVLNEWEQDLASEVAKVRSTPVLRRAREIAEERAKQEGRKPPALNYGDVDIEVVGKSNVIAIGYADQNPRVAQEMCDAVITAYLEYRREKDLGASDTLFRGEMEMIRRQIDQRLSQREAVAAHTGVMDPETQTRAWIEQVNYLEQHRGELNSQLAAQQSALASMRDMLDNKSVDLPTSDVQFTNENALRSLKDRIAVQQTRIATLRERYLDESPEVQNAMATLETLQALLRKEVEARLTMSQSRIGTLKSQIGALDDNIAEVKGKLAQIPADRGSIEDIDADIKTLRQRYDEYVKARDQARITSNVSSSVFVTLLNPPGPAVPKNTLDIVRLGLAPAFSLVVGIGLAFFIDGLDLTVRTVGQAEEYLELPVFATLSERRSRRR